MQVGKLWCINHAEIPWQTANGNHPPGVTEMSPPSPHPNPLVLAPQVIKWAESLVVLLYFG